MHATKYTIGTATMIHDSYISELDSYPWCNYAPNYSHWSWYDNGAQWRCSRIHIRLRIRRAQLKVIRRGILIRRRTPMAMLTHSNLLVIMVRPLIARAPTLLRVRVIIRWIHHHTHIRIPLRLRHECDLARAYESNYRDEYIYTHTANTNATNPGTYTTSNTNTGCTCYIYTKAFRELQINANNISECTTITITNENHDYYHD